MLSFAEIKTYSLSGPTNYTYIILCRIQTATRKPRNACSCLKINLLGSTIDAVVASNLTNNNT